MQARKCYRASRLHSLLPAAFPLAPSAGVAATSYNLRTCKCPGQLWVPKHRANIGFTGGHDSGDRRSKRDHKAVPGKTMVTRSPDPATTEEHKAALP